MPKTIYIIRHGETDANSNGIMQGQLDTLLNHKGLIQAKLLAKRLTDTNFDTIYSSDLKRAFQTAQAVAQTTNQKIISTLELRERNLGPFEGQNWESVVKKHSNFVNEAFGQDENNLGVESNHQIYNRIQILHHHLKTHQKNKTIALFTHGGTKKIAIKYFTKKSLDPAFSPSNTSVTILKKTWLGRYKIELLADISHLKGTLTHDSI